MRVLHLVKGLGPGGAERLIVSLCAARSPDVQFEVAYVLPHKTQLVAELSAAGATVHPLGGPRGLADLRWVHRLRRLVRRSEPDVVHIHSPAVAPLARLALRATRRRPVIVSIEQNVWASYRRSTRLANALTLPLSDDHLAVSEEVRSSMWPRFRGATEVVSNGIPVDQLTARRTERAAARAALGLTDQDVLVASVANFREKKDHPTLFAAAAACSDEPRLRFVVIGQGPLEDELRALHRSLGLADRVTFIGYHPDPPAVVAGADIFTLSSLHEGLPIAMLEAMALAVPPVVTAVGGVPEVVTDGVDGVLVSPRRPDQLANAYRDLAGDPDRRRGLGQAAARRAADFNIVRTQRDLELRYRQLLAGQGR